MIGQHYAVELSDWLMLLELMSLLLVDWWAGIGVPPLKPRIPLLKFEEKVVPRPNTCPRYLESSILSSKNI